jgi:hypothetical protein
MSSKLLSSLPALEHTHRNARMVKGRDRAVVIGASIAGLFRPEPAGTRNTLDGAGRPASIAMEHRSAIQTDETRKARERT